MAAKQTTLSVREDVANRVREVARNADVSVFDLASQLLEAALSAGELEFETRVVRIPLGTSSEPKKPRGRPPKK